MAVKATDQITLAVGVDVSSVDNYYKLQASSANPPTKPTTANPTGWSTTEPTYDGTTTNTLYICTKTTLTDNTFYWSAVSVSSSYEAAKQATNLANAANTLATAINNYFWHDSAGAHVGTVEGEAHTSTAGYNMTLGATNSNVGIVLEHNADILASFTAQALQFYANGLLSASYNSNGALLYATVNALAAVVAAFTASGVSFYDGNGTTDNNILAAFTNSGTQIGKKTETHVVIDNDSFDILDGLNRLLTQMNEAGWYRIIPIQQYQNDDPTQSENPYYDENRPYVYGLVLDSDVDDVLGLKHQLIFGDDYSFSYYDESLQDWTSWPGVNAKLEARAKGLAQIYMSAESKDNPGYYAAISASAGGSNPSLEGITLTSGTPSSSTGGLINIEGRLVLKYQVPLYGEDINLNSLIPLIHINTNGNIIVGNNNNSGSTRIYGNNVDIVSDGKFRMGTSAPVVVEYKDVTVSSTNAQSNFLTSVSVGKSGYTPTAVVGKYFTSGTRQNFLNDWGTHLEGNTLYVRLCNVHASQAANGTYRVQIEYHRNEML